MIGSSDSKSCDRQLDFFVFRSFARHFLKALETYVSQSCSCSLYRRADHSGVCRAAACRRRPGRPDRPPLASCRSRTGSTCHSCARGGSTAFLCRRIGFSGKTRTLWGGLLSGKHLQKGWVYSIIEHRLTFKSTTKYKVSFRERLRKP